MLDLRANDLVYDRDRGLIYATVPGSVPGVGNRVHVIDPLGGQVDHSVFVGSEPSKMALSDDGQYLYIALDGAAAVVRFELPNLIFDLQFPLGSDPSFGPFFVEDIEVQPDNPGGSTAASRSDALAARHQHRASASTRAARTAAQRLEIGVASSMSAIERTALDRALEVAERLLVLAQPRRDAGEVVEQVAAPADASGPPPFESRQHRFELALRLLVAAHGGVDHRQLRAGVERHEGVGPERLREARRGDRGSAPRPPRSRPAPSSA